MAWYLRRRSSTKTGGSLRCPSCWSLRLKFQYTYGRTVDVYRCKDCNVVVRYQTTPFDPISHGMSKQEAAAEGISGMTHRELSAYGKMTRQRKRHKLVKIPGIGTFQVRDPKKNPKEEISE